jgi:hypothetical protein
MVAILEVSRQNNQQKTVASQIPRSVFEIFIFGET